MADLGRAALAVSVHSCAVQVVDREGSAVKGATVLAVEASGRALRKASTQADGSYQIVIPVPGAKAAAKAASARASTRAAATGTLPPGLVVHLQVQIGKQTVLVNGMMNRVTAMALRFVPRSLIAKGTTRLTSRP